jgi:hypothetical protein
VPGSAVPDSDVPSKGTSTSTTPINGIEVVVVGSDESIAAVCSWWEGGEKGEGKGRQGDGKGKARVGNTGVVSTRLYCT